jgi:hypothetical protein
MDRSALTALYLDEVRQRGLRASDLMGDLPGLRSYYYEGKYLSRPLFIGHAECQRLYADVENVRTAVVSLPERLYGGDFAAFAEAAGAYGAVASVLAPYSKPPTQLARADLFLSQTGFQLLELNAGSAMGGTDNADMCRALLRNPVLAEFARAHGLSYVDTFRSQVDTTLAETGLDPDSHPVVALTRLPNHYDEVAMSPYQEDVAADWRKLGVDAHRCHLGELSYGRGRVWLGDKPVDAIYRMFFIGLLHEHRGLRALLKPILDAVARGEVRMCAPLESDMFSSKATVAMVSDDANRQLFTAAELESIDRIVPWTRLVRPGLVTVPDGSQAELLDYAMSEQNELILKPSMGWEGIGVMPGWELSPEEWQVQLTSVSAPWYVIQKRVRPETELFPGEDGELVPWTPVWGLFTGSRGYGGIYVRAVMDSSVSVVNRALGAFVGSCLSG